MSSRAPSPHDGRRRFQDLPAWYRRLLAISIKEDRDIGPWDFDHDISDLEETSETSEREDGSSCVGCKCDGDGDDCYCESERSGCDREDCSSQRSYDGSDADFYYELKDEREERKRELQEAKLEKLGVRDFEQKKVAEVEEAFVHMQNTCSLGDVTPHLDLLAAKLFDLFCIEHVDNCYNSGLPWHKYVEFYVLDEVCAQPGEEQASGDNSGQICGHVYFDGNNGCDLAPFIPPKLGGVDEHVVKSCDEECELMFRFISNDYLILAVPQRLVVGDQYPLPSAPATFKFVGIRLDRDKERSERRAKRKRSPSPGESWFEMSHPMDLWNLGGW